MDGYIGQVFLWSGTWIPQGYMACNGQALAIRNYAALYSIIGTYYGGDGVNTFLLPDLRGAIPVTSAPGYSAVGDRIGHPLMDLRPYGQTTSITISNLPAHTHQVAADSMSTRTTSFNLAIPAVSNFDAVTASAQPGPTMSLSVSNDDDIGGNPKIYSSKTVDTTLQPFPVSIPGQTLPAQPSMTSSAGQSTPLPLEVNLPGILVMNYIICVDGIYPSRP